MQNPSLPNSPIQNPALPNYARQALSASPSSAMANPASTQGLSQVPDSVLAQMHEALVDEYRKKHPQLGEFELYIAAEVNQVLEEASAQGVKIEPRDAMQLGIARFQKKFMQAARQQLQTVNGNPSDSPVDDFKSGKSQGVLQNTANPQNAQSLQNLQNLDLSSAPMTFGKLTPEDIWNMPEEQFQALDRKVRQKYYR